MILLSDIAILKVSSDLYSVVTPGYTRAETSSEGIICLVWGDGSRDLNEAVTRIEPHLSLNQWDVRGFIKNAIKIGLFYRAENYRRHVFAPDKITKAMSFEGFRSLSEVNLCPSNECNLRCSYCNLWKGNDKLSLSEIQKTLAEAHQLGANILNILGGEPTLYPELTAETITAAKDLGYERITVSINGTSFSKKTAMLWKQCGLNTLQVSVDGLKGRGKSLESCEEAIRMACAHFSEVIVGYVYYGQDSQINLLPLIARLKSYPIVLDLKIMIPLEGEPLPISPVDISQFSRESRQLSAKNNFIIPPELTDTRYVFCGAGICHLFIEANGVVKACGFINKHFGNVRKTSLISMWLSEKWDYFYRPKAIRKKQCLECDYREFCIAGCTARFRSKEKNCILTRNSKPSVPRRTCMVSKVR